MKLKKLIKDLDVKVIGSKEVEITALSSHSKTIAPGSLFIAKRGKSFDGNAYIFDAIQAGAVAILTDIYNPFATGIVQIITAHVNEVEAILAERFYENPSKDLFLAGVTGTNGKTTITYLLKHLFELQGESGLIGTIRTLIGQMQLANDLTTPDVISCHKILKEMVLHGIKNAFMEVTSHALCQNRVDGIYFDAAIFTNLTPEHLDYHGTMEAYAEAKGKLFTKLKKGGFGVINADDPWSKKISEGCKHELITYGIKEKADFSAKNIVLSLGGTTFTLCTPYGEIDIELPLTGRFNVYNALAAIAVAAKRGIPLAQIKERLPTFSQVPGRMQSVSREKGRHIFVDFAHTDDSLENVLSTLDELAEGRIITIFGCGGNRDREKRPRMARVAEKYSDYVIVTTDNSRNEEPEAIAKEIVSGFSSNRFSVELDRRAAIEKGMKMLEPGDTLLIAGKGHEKKQIFALKTIEFDDVEVAQEMINVLI